MSDYRTCIDPTHSEHCGDWWPCATAKAEARPDMVVRSAEGDRWGELGLRMTPAERDAAVDALIAKLEARLREGAR